MATKKSGASQSAVTGRFVAKERVVSAKVAKTHRASTVRNAGKHFAAKKQA